MARPKKNKLKTITVETLPNGYGLKVGKHEHLAFNERELLECMFVHIGLKMEDYMNKGTIRDLMTACATWPDATKGLSELINWKTQNAALHKTIKNLRDSIRRLEVTNMELQEALKSGKPLKSKHNAKIMHKFEAANDAPLMKMEQEAKEKGLIK